VKTILCVIDDEMVLNRLMRLMMVDDG